MKKKRLFVILRKKSYTCLRFSKVEFIRHYLPFSLLVMQSRLRTLLNISEFFLSSMFIYTTFETFIFLLLLSTLYLIELILICTVHCQWQLQLPITFTFMYWYRCACVNNQKTKWCEVQLKHFFFSFDLSLWNKEERLNEQNEYH